MGARQNKECVDNVQIPTWAKQDPRLFTLIHMQVCVKVDLHLVRTIAGDNEIFCQCFH